MQTDVITTVVMGTGMASEESVGGIRTRSTIKTTLVTFEFVANLEGEGGGAKEGPAKH